MRSRVLLFVAAVLCFTASACANEAPSPPAFTPRFSAILSSEAQFSEVEISQSGQLLYDLENKREYHSSTFLGTTQTYIFRYDQNVQYTMLNAMCFKSTLTGSLIPMGVPADLKYGGEATIDSQKVNKFSNTTDAWYVTEASPILPVRVTKGPTTVDYSQVSTAAIPEAAFEPPPFVTCTTREPKDMPTLEAVRRLSIGFITVKSKN